MVHSTAAAPDKSEIIPKEIEWMNNAETMNELYIRFSTNHRGISVPSASVTVSAILSGQPLKKPWGLCPVIRQQVWGKPSFSELKSQQLCQSRLYYQAFPPTGRLAVIIQLRPKQSCVCLWKATLKYKHSHLSLITFTHTCTAIFMGTFYYRLYILSPYPKSIPKRNVFIFKTLHSVWFMSPFPLKDQKMSQ